MSFQKISIRVQETAGCPLFEKGDVFGISGVAVLMEGEEKHSLITSTAVHSPLNRQNCKVLSSDFNRLIIEHERADLIPRGVFSCSGCGGSIKFEYRQGSQSDLENFLGKDEHASSLLHLLQNFPFFKNIARDDLENVVKSFGLREFRRHEIIMRHGDRGDNFYVVVSGKVSVLNENGLSIATLEQGEVFGEMSLLSDEEVSATVQAVEDSEVLHAPNRDIKKLLKNYPVLQQYFARLLAKRLSSANKFRTVDFVSIMTGRLEEIPPEALFLTLHTGGKTGILAISGLPGGNARFSLRQGALIKAGYNGRKGKSAFYDILKEKKGLYKFTPGLPPDEFDAPEIGYFMKLLMTGLEKMDKDSRE